MYDDKWTEVNNNQNDQNNQSGPQAAGNQTGMASRPDSRYTGSAARDSPRTRIRARRTSGPSTRMARRTSTIIPLRIPIRDRTETAG